MSLTSKASHLLIRRPLTFASALIKQLAFDYREALVETGRKCVQHPLKTMFYSTNVAILIYAYQTMPSFESYQSQLNECRQQEILISIPNRSKQVEIYFDTIEQLLASEKLHFVDCFLFSLIIYRSQSRTDGRFNRAYENLCSYLHLKRHSRIVDIGAFNRWFTLKKKFEQADIFDDINTSEKT